MTAGNQPAALRPGQGALGSALRSALAGYRRRVDSELAAAGFADRRFPEGRVLLMCSGPGQTTISDVGRGLGITRQGASKIVAGLRERGYVDVTASADDAREKILTLTPRAVEYLAALRRAATEIERRLSEEIGAEAVEQLFRLLGALSDGGAEWPGDRDGTLAARVLRWRNAQEGSPA
jgi:DNA-binding MarR family transcriptional regulator